MTPYRDALPYVHLNPTTPLNHAGCRILHPVSVPSDTGTIPAATAAADPEELHPGTRVVSQGFFVVLMAEFSPVVPIANSSQLSFPIESTPADFSFFVTVDS